MVARRKTDVQNDGMQVFNLAQPGETVTVTAVWE